MTGGLTWVIMFNARPDGGYQNDSVTMLLVPISMGALIGMIAFRFWTLYFALIPLLGGLTLALYICCWQEDLVISQTAGRLVFIICFPFFTVFLLIFCMRHVLLLATSFAGAFTLIIGIDFFAHTGYLSGLWLLVTSEDKPYELTRVVYIMLAAVLFLFFASCLWQAVFNVALPDSHVLSQKALTTRVTLPFPFCYANRCPCWRQNLAAPSDLEQNLNNLPENMSLRRGSSSDGVQQQQQQQIDTPHDQPSMTQLPGPSQPQISLSSTSTQLDPTPTSSGDPSSSEPPYLTTRTNYTL
ncbi:hypothetical protein BC940DRAFT_245182 [Gongronella butleri]|nr:hypothetical protein BC940DRAFT_245182 [Gongronella butleri]